MTWKDVLAAAVFGGILVIGLLALWMLELWR
jgi:hypothetical protein